MKHRLARLIYFILVLTAVSSVVALIVNYVIMPIIVSKGNERILLSVVDLNWEEASDLLRREGFQAMRGDTRAVPDLPPFTVLEQRPAAGQKVKLGRRVYLTLSTEEKNFPIPDLIGKTLRGATLLIDDSKLQLDTVLYVNSSRPKDVVVQQFPERGSKVSRNTPVILRVSLGISSEFTVPDLVFSSEHSAVEMIEKAGFKLGNIIYEVSDDFTPYTVISQSLEPGRKFTEKMPINLVISKLPENLD